MTKTKTTRKQIKTLQDCFEGGMDFDTALGCAGLGEADTETREKMFSHWFNWEQVLEEI